MSTELYTADQLISMCKSLNFIRYESNPLFKYKKATLKYFWVRAYQNTNTEYVARLKVEKIERKLCNCVCKKRLCCSELQKFFSIEVVKKPNTFYGKINKKHVVIFSFYKKDFSRKDAYNLIDCCVTLVNAINEGEFEFIGKEKDILEGITNAY